MKLIPQPKETNILKGKIELSSITEICLDENCDYRVVKLTNKLCDEIFEASGKKMRIVTSLSDKEKSLCITHGKNGEEYSLVVCDAGVEIKGKGPAGAFYGIQTLRQIIHQYKTYLPLCEIKDCPKFNMRGFYHDVTRGRVPTSENLHKIVDKMAYCKMNSLQLYIEDAFDFSEYEGIIAKDDKMYAHQMLELDQYCYDNFIELIPSLSTFGHLYNLLQSDKYKHLCELTDFVPTQHYWLEKMQHHTINPSDEESIKLIFSLIDQYLPLFRSKYFNICCDETFDLGTGKNKGKDVSKTYFDFVNKIAEHLISKGKTVMMWADIAIKHSDKISSLNKNIILLNWNYSGNPLEDNFAIVNNCKFNQVACPGTTSWNRFVENIIESEKNIKAIATYAKKYNALGILTTNWGDCGHICSFNNISYGMALGAQLSWDPDFDADKDFEIAVCSLFYDTEINIIKIIRQLAECELSNSWHQLITWYSKTVMQNEVFSFDVKPDDIILNLQKVYDAREKLKQFDINDERINDLILACRGIEILNRLQLCIEKEKGYCDVSKVQNLFYSWFEDYKEAWLRDNKTSELYRIKEFLEDVITALNNKKIS